MFYDAGTDQRTLEQIRKAMPAESIDRADADGIFDMLKGYDKSKLHPKKVVVHGKKGNFISTRMAKDDEVTVPQASKPSFNPFDKLDAKLKRDRIDRMNRDEDATDSRTHRSLVERFESFSGRPFSKIPREASAPEVDWGKPRGAEIW